MLVSHLNWFHRQIWMLGKYYQTIAGCLHSWEPPYRLNQSITGLPVGASCKWLFYYGYIVNLQGLKVFVWILWTESVYVWILSSCAYRQSLVCAWESGHQWRLADSLDEWEWQYDIIPVAIGLDWLSSIIQLDPSIASSPHCCVMFTSILSEGSHQSTYTHIYLSI